MKLSSVALLGMSLVVVHCGCARKTYDGPTVDAFTGRLVHDGQPVSFPADEKVMLQLFHEKGRPFGIPIQPDGSFKIGWMPIGKYTAMLQRSGKGAVASPGGPIAMGLGGAYTVPNGLTIEAGKTEYTIELGKEWKP